MLEFSVFLVRHGGFEHFLPQNHNNLCIACHYCIEPIDLDFYRFVGSFIM